MWSQKCIENLPEKYFWYNFLKAMGVKPFGFSFLKFSNHWWIVSSFNPVTDFNISTSPFDNPFSFDSISKGIYNRFAFISVFSCDRFFLREREKIFYIGIFWAQVIILSIYEPIFSLNCDCINIVFACKLEKKSDSGCFWRVRTSLVQIYPCLFLLYTKHFYLIRLLL